MENVQSTYRIPGRSAGFSSILLEGDQKNDEIVPGRIYYIHTHFNRHPSDCKNDVYLIHKINI